MRPPWRRPPVVIDEKFMATNWAQRGLIIGLFGSSFCLVMIVWGVVAVTPAWWKWPYVAVMVVLLWVNARLIPSNWRSSRTHAERHAVYLAQQAHVQAMLTDAGIPEDIARRIDWLALEGRLEEALTLVEEHAQQWPHP